MGHALSGSMVCARSWPCPSTALSARTRSANGKHVGVARPSGSASADTGAWFIGWAMALSLGSFAGQLGSGSQLKGPTECPAPALLPQNEDHIIS